MTGGVGLGRETSGNLVCPWPGNRRISGPLLALCRDIAESQGVAEGGHQHSRDISIENAGSSESAQHKPKPHFAGSPPSPGDEDFLKVWIESCGNVAISGGGLRNSHIKN